MNSISTDMIMYRAKHKLSQTECAEKAGISLQTWNQIECGRQKPARVTEVKIRLVIGEDECKEVSAD